MAVLKNLGIIWFSWSILFSLWPLLLVLWGISLIPARSWIKLVLSFLAIILGVVLANQYSPKWNFSPRWHGFQFHHNNRNYSGTDNDDDQESDEETTYSLNAQQLDEAYHDNIKEAKLWFDAGAGDFNIQGTTTQLISFSSQGNVGDYKLRTREVTNERTNLHLTMPEHHFRGKVQNHVEVKLSPEPLWDFDFDIGAADVQLDLRPFRVRNINIDGGAANVGVKLGDLAAETDLDIDAGAASFTIRVPKSAACEVRTQTVLTSRTLPGFDKIEKGLYRTDNFNDADQKITIRLNGAVSSITVQRYE
jgi:hypothetical protein